MRIKALKLLALLAVLLMMVSVVSASDGPSTADLKEVTDVKAVGQGKLLQPKGAAGPAMYIVQLTDAPLASYRGGTQGLAATSPSLTGQKLNVSTPASVAYLTYISEQQASLLAQVEAITDSAVTPLHQYTNAFNGVAIELTPLQAAEVSKLPGVSRVQRNFNRYLQTDHGPAWIGAPSMYDGTSTGGAGTMGEGVVVAVLDSGINTDHPSFAAVGGDGYEHPAPAGGFLGWCDSTDPDYDATLVCNNKLIGLRSYPDSGNDPEDDDGHGSHTASTTAGNVVESTIYGPTISITESISGVAPHAQIIAYDVCDGGCALTAIVAAIDDTVVDGADIINYSIGGGISSAWEDADTLAFLAATDAGILPVTSAGNSGPDPETVGGPADTPWMLSVGASTHNRKFINTVGSMTSDGDPLADIVGLGFTAGYGPASIVYAGDFPNANDPDGDPGQCLEPYPAGTFAGEIVICDRGAIARVAKGENVLAGGAGGFVLANDEANGDSLVGDAHFLPGVHISYANGVVLKEWVANNDNTMATISGATADVQDANGDIMAAFSSRGPITSADVIKPDVTAPGVDIWAAVNNDDGATPDGEPEYGFLSGTSMASPHTAGAATLMKATYPDWTPAQIKSAMMSTAKTDAVYKEDATTPADPFDMGGGRVDLNLAPMTGLVLDITTADFEAADPFLGGDPRELNLPSMMNSSCVQECSWTRTVMATSGGNWSATLDLPEGIIGTVEPESFTLAAGETQDVTVTVDVLGVDSGMFYFGSLMLDHDGEGVADTHMPIAVQPNTGDLPDLVEVNTGRNAGSQVVADVTAIEITDFTSEVYGLAKADQVVFAVEEDPTNDDPTNDVYYLELVDVPADTSRFVIEILESTSPDLDLFIFNPEGAQVCSSATGSALEYCDIATPEAGTWYVVVQNWQGSSEGAWDTGRMAIGLVPSDDAGNLTVTGPESAAALEPFDLTLTWDLDTAAGDVWYGVVSIGTDAANAGNVGMFAVNLYRNDDDVVKSVSPAYALAGDTVTFELTVNPNTLPEDIDMTVVDAIPAGLTYVDGSATASAGTVDVTDGVVTWTGTLPNQANLAPTYNISTSDADPACGSLFGGYVDLEGLGIAANPAIEGDTVAYTAGTSGAPFSFYGVDYAGISFTDDGFAIFDAANNWFGAPWFAQEVPDADGPNNVAAALWQDMEIVYDAALNRGVSLASTGDTAEDVYLIEYDDVQLFGDPSNTYDFQIQMLRGVDNTPGVPEIVYAYANLTGTLEGPMTVGAENAAASDGVAVVNNESGAAVINDGMVVCLDAVVPSADPVTITFDVTVDEGASVGDIIQNMAVSTSSNAGSVEDAAYVGLRIGHPTFMPVLVP